MTPPDRRPALLGPSRLAPLDIDLARVILAGIALWAVALLVSAGLTLAGVLHGRAVPICAAGIALGLLALLWERRRRRRADSATQE